MPTYNYYCPTCKVEFKRLFNRKPIRAQVHMQCGSETRRVVTATPTHRVTEVLDNSVMVKPVERLTDIEEIMEERSRSPEAPEPDTMNEE